MLIIPKCMYFITLPTPLIEFASLSLPFLILLTPLNHYTPPLLLGFGGRLGVCEGTGTLIMDFYLLQTFTVISQTKYFPWMWDPSKGQCQ